MAAQHTHTQAETQGGTFDITERASTCVRGSLLVAPVTHSDRAETPASLGDGRSFGGAAVAEALPAGTAVMFGVVVLEDCVTLIAHLRADDNNDTCRY